MSFDEIAPMNRKEATAAFSREAGRAVALYILRPDRKCPGDLSAKHAARAVTQFLKCTLEPRPGPLCLACDTEFYRRAPSAFVVTAPAFNANPTLLVVTGICAACAAQDDERLLDVAKRHWFEANPGAFSLPTGNA